jgi:hypothetical protein
MGWVRQEEGCCMDWVRQEEGLAYGLGAPKGGLVYGLGGPRGGLVYGLGATGGLLKGTIAPIPLCPGGAAMPKPPPSPVLYGVGTL